MEHVRSEAARVLLYIGVDGSYPFESIDGVLFNSDTLVRFPPGQGGDYVIPDDAWYIKDFAFEDCANIKSLKIGERTHDIGVHTFVGCKNLKSFSVSRDNWNYKVSDGVLFDDTMSTLIRFPCGKGGNYTVPKKIWEIEEYAFEGSESLESIMIPASVRRINEGAFNGCSKLQFVGYKGDYDPAFYSFSDNTFFDGCSELEEVCVPPDYSSDSFCGFTNLTRSCLSSDSSATSSHKNSELNQPSGSQPLGHFSYPLLAMVIVAALATI